MMKPDEYSIVDLIPQRPPVVMIDKLAEADGGSATGVLYISADNIFTTGGYFSEAGLTEFIAQTAAAFKGWQHVSSGNEVKRGYIAAIKNLQIFFLPPSGNEIRCSIRVDNEVIGYTIVLGKIYMGDSIVAEAELRIILEN